MPPDQGFPLRVQRANPLLTGPGMQDRINLTSYQSGFIKSRMKPKSNSRSLRMASACAEKLKVLSDPTRMQVLDALLAGPQHVNTLMKTLKIEQSLLSH